MSDIAIEHHFGYRSYIKEVGIPAGVTLPQHSHPHGHWAHLDAGRARVTCGIALREFDAPKWIWLPANIGHSVAALTDVKWSCVWGTDDTNPETVDTSILEGS